ncbi:hypothetical protein [Lentzea terrae]|uniref:hypothetical protein n=1 Tax=Lentzea terrae TaxID=2200761 RepID=UPI000DD47B3D|nr:hypothetical protein [Lentzea terrae]
MSRAALVASRDTVEPEDAPRLVERLLPATPAATGKRTALGYLAAFVAAVGFLLLIPAGRSHLDHVWAEDGALFLLESITKPFAATVFDPYAGYLHTLPRLVAELVSLLPLEWAAAGFAIAAACLRAVVALIVFAASGGVLRSLPVRFALAAVVIVLPAGNTETINNMANLHWFLLYGVFWALLWRPAARWQNVAGAVFVALAAASTPMVVFLAPIALLRLVLPGRMITIGFFLGSAAQACAVLLSEGRAYSKEAVDPLQLVLAAAFRGPLVALTGSEGVAKFFPRFGFWPALAAVLVFLVPIVFALVWGSPAHRFVAVSAVTLHGLVLGASLVANWMGGLEVHYVWAVMFGQRYSIAPCLFLFAALAVGLDTVRRPRWARGTVLTTRVLVTLSVLASIYLHTTAPAGRVHGTALGGRLDGPAWAPGVAKARESCARGESVGRIAQEPVTEGWEMGLPCAFLKR